jgi:hypothetical protein
MKRTCGLVIGLGLFAVATLLAALSGCQTPGRSATAQSSTSTQPAGPADTMARSDAERAKADIERNQREVAGERRPYRPQDRPVVDQSRVPARP